MAATVVVNFKMGGEDALLRSIRTVSQSATRIAVSDAQKRTQAERSAGKSRIDREKQAARDIASVNKELNREISKQSKDAVNAARAAAKERLAIERQVNREIAADVRKMAKESEAAAKRVAAVGAARSGVYGGGAMAGLRRGAGVAGAATGLVTSAIGTAGIIDAVRNQMALQRSATQLSADIHTEGGFADPQEMITKAQKVAKATGIASTSVMEALSLASAHGGGEKGLKAFAGSLEKIGSMSLATGTKIEDLAEISAAMTNANVTSSDEQFEVMRSINAAAKEGNVNFKEMASYMTEVTSMHGASAFKATAVQRQLESSGMIQIAKMGSGSAAEAATSARSFMADLTGATAQKFASAKGFSLYEKNAKGERTGLRAMPELIADIYKNAKGDPEVLNKLFQRESKATVAQFTAAYKGENSNLKDANGNNLSGVDGVKALLANMTQQKQSEASVEAEATQMKRTAAVKFEMAMENFRAAVGEKLLPKLIEASPALLKLTDMAIALAGAFAEAPELVAGGFLAANAMMGATEASFAALVESNGVLAGKNATAGTGLASAMVVVATGVAAFAATTALLDKINKEDEAKEKKKKDAVAKEADELIGKVNDGTATPADIEKLKTFGVAAKERAGYSMFDAFQENVTENFRDPNANGILSGSGIADEFMTYGRSALAALGNDSSKADYQGISDAILTALQQKGGATTSATAALEGEKANAAADILKAGITVTVKNASEIGGGERVATSNPIYGSGGMSTF